MVSRSSRQHEQSLRALGAALGLAVAGLGTGCQREKPAPLPPAFEGISLVDQDGAALSGSSVSNRPLLVSFMFTSCPTVCPEQTEALAQVRDALPPEVRESVRFVSVSVDPENDTPGALKQFALAHHADDEGWSFVRSDVAGTQLLTTRLAALDPAGSAPSAHNTSLYLFDRGGRLVQRYRGAPLDVPHLARELVVLDDLKPSEARLARN